MNTVTKKDVVIIITQVVVLVTILVIGFQVMM